VNGTGRLGRGPSRRAPRGTVWVTVAIVATIGIAYAVVLRTLYDVPGPAMEEGFMLVFPDRILHGDVANRDFLNLYGPGSLWVLAGAYRLFGVTVAVERTIGLVQLVGTTVAICLLVRWWGRSVALTAGLLSVIFGVPAVGLVAIPWAGGVALGLFGVLALRQARVRDACGGAGVGRFALVAGLLFGCALLYRLDLVVAVGLGAIVLLWGASRRIVGRAALGFAIGLVPYLVHVVTAGPAAVWRGMVIDPMFHLRAGRHLDVPPDPGHLVGVARVIGAIDRPWPLPRLSPSQQLFSWFVLLIAATLFVVVVAAWSVYRDRGGLRPRVLLAAALFAGGLLPQAIQRADSAHLGWVSSVTIALVPAAVVELVWQRQRRTGATARSSRSPGRAGIIACVVTSLVVVFLLPTYVARRYVSLVEDSVDGTRHSVEVRRDGRSFLVGSEGTFATSVRRLLRGVDRNSRPGDRVIVATGDLRRTPYIDSFLYHLLPDLPPGTRFIEMEPGITNRRGTPLADELRRADLVIVSRRWDGWDEPNASMKPGDPAPARVFADRFCQVGDYGDGFSLHRPCPGR
jgi:hypothetical protein